MPPTRAKQACSFCNGRRIKCNVMESIPCHNCIAANVGCKVRESGRGKWSRPAKGRAVRASNEAAPAESANLTPDEPALSQDNEIYLGESTLLRAVRSDWPKKEANRSATSDLRYPVPTMASVPNREHQRRTRRLQTLAAEGAMELPDRSIQHTLFEAYFNWFHTCFPVVNKHTVLRQSQADDISPMLCHAMIFIGVIHCEERKLREIGLVNNEEARHLFYHRAKDLHDADFETDSLVQLQTMFLLSFWRAGPLLQKDCRYWLGNAITLAQKKAMHRSFGRTHLAHARLRKRVWWSIYVRERQCAAALGLPNRIRDEDCDVEGLTLQDFDDLESPNALDMIEYRKHCHYVMEMAKLAVFLGRIICKEYLPSSGDSRDGRAQLISELNAWHRQLPDILRLGTDSDGLSVGTLHIAYNNLLILLSRRAFIGGYHSEIQEDGKLAYRAACQISRIAEDLLAEGLLGYGQIHLITCIFNALCIHTVNLPRLEGTSRLVAEHRAKICLYGLRELQKTWEVTNWILQLFFQFLDRSMARGLQTSDQEEGLTQVMPVMIENPVPADLSKVTASTPKELYTELEEQRLDIPLPLPFDSDAIECAVPEGQDEFWANAFSNLDGLAPADLEHLANCLT